MQDITQEDGSKKPMMVDEGKNIFEFLKTGTKPDTGVWIGGKKRQLRSPTGTVEEYSAEGSDYKCLKLELLLSGQPSFILLCSHNKPTGKALVVLAEYKDKDAEFPPSDTAWQSALEFTKWAVGTKVHEGI